tara:strand:- start:66 stop:413 length:348 start_codon:yes stop_codon:yes gene_type:complete
MQTKIPDPYLLKYILSLKKFIEQKEILNYHNDRWNNIGLKYKPHSHSSGEWDKYGPFSINHSENEYSIVKDKVLNFYNETDISYQIVYLLHHLICMRNKKNKKQTNYMDFYQIKL